MELAGLEGTQVLVGLQLALGDLEHLHGDVGAVVCGTLAGGQQILQNEAILHGAQAITQAADMAALDLPDQRINDLLLGLDFHGVVEVEAAVGGNGATDNIQHSLLQDCQLSPGLAGNSIFFSAISWAALAMAMA